MNYKELYNKIYNHFENVPKEYYMDKYDIPERYNPTLISKLFLKYLKINKITKHLYLEHISSFMKQVDKSKIIY